MFVYLQLIMDQGILRSHHSCEDLPLVLRKPPAPRWPVGSRRSVVKLWVGRWAMPCALMRWVGPVIQLGRE